ncbi:arginase family protein [Ensifer sp. ENS05]|uniref:arginase family protein n=1 Tax=Ensifer sp. ENS05 TaxID=2769277 RepID=UPI002811D570|nr:arginase family protein [Ensifer sp. ENS05]
MERLRRKYSVPYFQTFRSLISCTKRSSSARVQLEHAGDSGWPREQGFRVVPAEDCWHRSLAPLMAEVRKQIGTGPVYISYDIDSLDPGIAPKTGTTEIGGLTTIQALEIIRACRGLNIVGADLAEVSPPFDTPAQQRSRVRTSCSSFSACSQA